MDTQKSKLAINYFMPFKILFPYLCIAIFLFQACTQATKQAHNEQEDTVVETVPDVEPAHQKPKPTPIPENLGVEHYPITWFNEGLGTIVDTTVGLDFLQENIGYFNFRYPPLKAMVPVENTLRLYNDSISIRISTIPFKPNKHRLEYDGKLVERIDGKTPWGTDGFMPHTEIASIELTIRDHKVALPSEHFSDLFEARIHPSNLNTHRGYIAQNQEIILNMMNGDGAGGYHAIFIFDDQGRFKRRLVGSGF